MAAGLVFDPATRDLVLAGNAPLVSDGPETEMLLAIGIERNSFHGDPDQGSLVPALVSGPPPVDPKREVEEAARDALARLEARGRITVNDVRFDGRELTIDVDGHSVSMEVRP